MTPKLKFMAVDTGFTPGLLGLCAGSTPWASDALQPDWQGLGPSLVTGRGGPESAPCPVTARSPHAQGDAFYTRLYTASCDITSDPSNSTFPETRVTPNHESPRGESRTVRPGLVCAWPYQTIRWGMEHVSDPDDRDLRPRRLWGPHPHRDQPRLG